MRKKKGFTLIELLAVIVILAIIALIATPIVMNVIENSRKGAAERSAENHLSVIETAIMEARIDGPLLSDGTYDLTTLETKLGILEVSGQKATEASIIVKDGQVLDGSTLEINGYVANIINGAGKVGKFGTPVADIPGQTTAIQYDPVVNAKCTSGDTCYNWYVLEDKGTDYAYVRLLMDRNLGEAVAWGNSGDTTPTKALPYLQFLTSDWKVNVSLPTYAQIYGINGNVSLSNSPWVYSNLPTSDDMLSYWTSTLSNMNDIAYVGSILKRIDTNSIDEVWRVGIRPVITVAKDKLQ